VAQPRLVNDLVTLLLRSPGLHRVGSGDVMLIEVIGRKTGRIYRIPVGYARYGSTVFTTTDDRWWRNLSPGAPVRLLLARRWHGGLGTAVTDRDAAVDGMRQLITGCPRYAKWLNIRRVDEQATSADLRREFDSGRILIHITDVAETRHGRPRAGWPCSARGEPVASGVRRSSEDCQLAGTRSNRRSSAQPRRSWHPRLPAPRAFSAVAATPVEISAPRAGDDLIAADVVMDRAFTVAGSPDAVWPWITQLGKGRAGWYLPRHVERFLPPSRRAAREIRPEWQRLQVGDVIPDYGGRQATFTVAIVEPPSTLVFRSRRGQARLTWSIMLGAPPDSAASTRVHLRLRIGPVHRTWLAESVGGAVDLLTIAGLAAGLRERLRATT
jgi:hypothetical protein